MGKKLFIVRDHNGNEIHSMEVISRENMFLEAHYMMDACRITYPDKRVDHCEIWDRPDHAHMELLITVF